MRTVNSHVLGQSYITSGRGTVAPHVVATDRPIGREPQRLAELAILMGNVGEGYNRLPSLLHHVC